MTASRIIITVSIFLGILFTSTMTSSGFAEIPKQKILQGYIEGDILYVGGSGPHNYSRIQDAVNHATPGDIIFVYSLSSPYYENIIITKNDIQLFGENKNSTIIDGNNIGSVIEITGDRATVTGFTLQHSGSVEHPDYNSGLHLLYPSSHNNIINNIVIENWNGICLQASKNNTISKNIVINNSKGLSIFADSVHNIISQNNVENNEYGFYFAFTVYNTIIDNNIKNNSICGLYLYFVRLQTIRRNNFINNTCHVYFIERLRLASDRNYWIRNYWDTWIGFGPKILKGQMFTEWVGQKLVPWINFDWFPARKLYTF